MGRVRDAAHGAPPPGVDPLAALLSLIAVLVLAGVAGCASGGPRTGPEEVDLEQLVAEFVDANPGPGEGRYTTPSGPEARVLADAVGLARRGDVAGADRLLRPLDHGVREVRDEATGRRLLVLEERPTGSDARRRGWGLAVVAPDAGPGPVIEVPHPAADRSSELLGVEVFRASAGSGLLVAGAHRSATSAADVADAPDSAFHAMHQALVSPGRRVLQVHGFDGDDHPRRYGDTVVSDGAEGGGPPGPATAAVASALEGAGFRVCLQHRDRCDRLAATRNVQGVSVRARDGEFVHLEVEAAVRADPDGRRRIASIAAGSLR